MEFVSHLPTLKSTRMYYNRESNSLFEGGFDFSLSHEEFVSNVVCEFCHYVICNT